MISKLSLSRSCAISLTISLALLCSNLSADLPTSSPEEVGLRSERLALIDGLVAEGLEKKRMPGCVIAIGRRGKLAYLQAFGHRQLEPEALPMQLDTVFDMASITKPVATATSVMMLVERGKLRVRDKVATYIPQFANSGKDNVTLMECLTHQAGFIPDNAVGDYKNGRKAAFENIYKLGTKYDPGTSFVYSDVGFILLDDLIERASGQTVAEFSKQHIFNPLGMSESGYLPKAELRARAATTEQREIGGPWMQGEVHDPRSHLMSGVAGHAGLFSTAKDLAIYAQMMLNGGTYHGKRILSRATVEMMTRDYKIVEGKKVSIRGLGWDKLTGYSSNRGENMSPRAFGHGGFTGTVLWIDPELEMFFIFLSNRVHPNGKGSVNRLAGRIATLAVGAIDDEMPNQIRELDSQPKTAAVQTGIDRLVASEFAALKSQRVGLITNHTGVDSAGTSTISLLAKSPHVKLTALFSPEHGIAGKLDQSLIDDGVDRDSGLEVYSLYGETRQPTAKQLDQIDTLVFDIQDIGCRYYTYISTMGLAMTSAASHGKRFIVLDRPNPIAGTKIGGPMLDDGKESFVGFHRLPIQHAMTIGELARMFKVELKLDLDLEVVPCSGWRRDQYFDETGLSWINPSPNMRSLNQAILYPAIGVWETTNLSVGRGTDTPFELVGAPWITSGKFAKALNEAKIPGVQFTPRDFVPTSSKFANKSCGGVQISITDRDQVDSTHLGVTFASVLWQLYPKKWQLEKSMRLLGSQSTLDSIRSNKPAHEIQTMIEKQFADFRQRRAQYLLY